MVPLNNTALAREHDHVSTGGPSRPALMTCGLRINKTQAFIDKNLQATPHRSASGNTVLRQGRSSRILAKGGALTTAGQYWQRQRGESLDVGHPEPFRKGLHEFALVNGKSRRLRSWDAAENRFVRHMITGKKY